MERSAFEDEASENANASRAHVAAASTVRNGDDDSEYETDSEEECDPDGAVAICEACNKVVAQSRYERHLTHFCKKQLAECPYCFLKFPLL